MTSLRTLSAFSLALALVGCDFSTPLASQHPSIQRLPGSVDATPQEQEKALFTTARVDLSCERVELVSTLTRKYVNASSARYVVEGCDKRALYVETCDAYPSCRYLVVSVVDLTTINKGAPPVVPGAAPPPPPASGSVAPPLPPAPSSHPAPPPASAAPAPPPPASATPPAPPPPPKSAAAEATPASAPGF